MDVKVMEEGLLSDVNKGERAAFQSGSSAVPAANQGMSHRVAQVGWDQFCQIFSTLSQLPYCYFTSLLPPVFRTCLFIPVQSCWVWSRSQAALLLPRFRKE